MDNKQNYLSNSFIAAVLAVLVFKQEKLTAAKIPGSVLGFIGIIVVQKKRNC